MSGSFKHHKSLKLGQMIYIHGLTKPTPTRRLPIKFLNVVLDRAYLLLHVFHKNPQEFYHAWNCRVHFTHQETETPSNCPSHTSISVTAKIHTQVRTLPKSRRHLDKSEPFSGSLLALLLGSVILKMFYWFSSVLKDEVEAEGEPWRPWKRKRASQGLERGLSSADPPNWGLVPTIHPTFPTFKTFLDSGMTWNTVPHLCLQLFAPKRLSIFFNCAEHPWFSQCVQGDVVFEESWFGNFHNYTLSKPILALYQKEQDIGQQSGARKYLRCRVAFGTVLPIKMEKVRAHAWARPGLLHQQVTVRGFLFPFQGLLLPSQGSWIAHGPEKASFRQSETRRRERKVVVGHF